MKLDKETLIKQRFWFLLGSFVPLVLIIWIMLITSVSGTVAKERDEVDKTKKAIDSIKDPKNEEFVTLLRQKQEKLSEAEGQGLGAGVEDPGRYHDLAGAARPHRSTTSISATNWPPMNATPIPTTPSTPASSRFSRTRRSPAGWCSSA